MRDAAQTRHRVPAIASTEHANQESHTCGFLDRFSHRSRRVRPTGQPWPRTCRPVTLPSTWGIARISQPGVAAVPATRNEMPECAKT